MEIDAKEIAALVRLLDDPDEEVFNNVESRLLSLGNSVISQLEEAWQNSFDALLQQKLESVIHKIQFGSVKTELQAWKDTGGKDLLKGVLIVNRYQYPDLNEQKLENLLEGIRRDAWLEMTYEMTAPEKVNILNHVFYRIHKFSGNTANYQDPQNSYLNLVLESKKGNQISLAIIYSLVAQRLNIPVFGVNLPQHFILAYLNTENDLSLTDPADDNVRVLFYINAFNKGFMFSRKEVDHFLKQLNLRQREEFYLPCPPLDIVRRIIRNLVGSYEKLGYELKVRELYELAEILDAGITGEERND